MWDLDQRQIKTHHVQPVVQGRKKFAILYEREELARRRAYDLDRFRDLVIGWGRQRVLGCMQAIFQKKISL